MVGANRKALISLTAIGALVIGIYAYIAQSGLLEMLCPTAAETYYNLLVRGFQDGHLSLKKDVPPGLAQLATPYDPDANAPYRRMPYRLHDISFYKNRLYLYYGATPALILFWPCAVVTGHYLFHRQAVEIFCAIGFLASIGLLFALWRRYFSSVAFWIVAACAMALGLATGAPILLSQADIYQVPISCGYMLTMLTLGAIWFALHRQEQRGRWLAAASLTYGLAIAARPALLFGAVLLLIPIAASATSPTTGKPLNLTTFARLVFCALIPIALIGLGVLFYNYQRFDNPLEFGQHYQLTGDFHTLHGKHFSLDFLWFNLRLYFFKSMTWSSQFPFVRKMVVPPLPPGHDSVEDPFGILLNTPLVWLALAVPLALRDRSNTASALRWFVATLTALFAITTLTIGLYYFTCVRYEVEFLPELLLLAVLGILGSERALAPKPAWRWAVRSIWILLLTISVAFNFLASVPYHAEAHHFRGIALLQSGNISGAIQEYKEAVRLRPDYAPGYYNLAVILEKNGETSNAINQYRQALRFKPDFTEAQNALARLKANP